MLSAISGKMRQADTHTHTHTCGSVVYASGSNRCRLTRRPVVVKLDEVCAVAPTSSLVCIYELLLRDIRRRRRRLTTDSVSAADPPALKVTSSCRLFADILFSVNPNQARTVDCVRYDTRPVVNASRNSPEIAETEYRDSTSRSQLPPSEIFAITLT